MSTRFFHNNDPTLNRIYLTPMSMRALIRSAVLWKNTLQTWYDCDLLKINHLIGSRYYLPSHQLPLWYAGAIPVLDGFSPHLASNLSGMWTRNSSTIAYGRVISWRRWKRYSYSLSVTKLRLSRQTELNQVHGAQRSISDNATVSLTTAQTCLQCCKNSLVCQQSMLDPPSTNGHAS